MDSPTSSGVKPSIPFKKLRQIISLGALALALVHIIWPMLAIDFVALGLIVVATLPWLAPLVKSLELPGGWKVEFAEISRHIIEDKIPPGERDKFVGHQIVSSMSGEGASYKLYSNGILTQRIKANAVNGPMKLAFPVSFPNEVTSIEIIGDLAATVTDLSLGGFTLNCPPQSFGKELEIVASGL